MILADIDISGYDTILLDRDGTINRQIVGDYVRSWDQFEFIPGALEAIARFSKTAKHIFIVTNQRGVGRGKMTESQLTEIHNRMIAEIESYGGRIDKVYYCTATNDTDINRKPNPGMWQQLKAEYPDVVASRTVMVGDGDCDMEFGLNCGIDTIRVGNVKCI